MSFLYEINKINKEENDNCNFHSSANADFLCLDCKNFICKHCYVNNHIDHYAKVPQEAIKENINLIEETIKELNNLNQSQKSKSDQGDFSKKLISQKEKISNDMIDLQIKNEKEIIKTVNNMRPSNEKDLFKERVFKYCNKLKKTLDDLNEIENYNKEMISENDNKLKKSNLLELISEKGIDLFSNEQEEFDSIQEIFNNYIKNPENSVISNNSYNKIYSYMIQLEDQVRLSCKLKRCNKIYSIRRFNSFLPNEKTRYFKRTSLQFCFSSNVILTGIGVCGLINSQKDMLVTCEILKMNIKPVNEKEGRDEIEYEKVMNENFSLSNPKNSFEPIFQFNFKDPIEALKNESYILTIDNNTDETYVNTFCGSAGEVNKFFKIQEFIQNNTNIKIKFSRPKDVYSDFDEISIGIICDFYFGI